MRGQVFHIAVEIRRFNTGVLRRQAGDGAFQIANSGQMLIDARFVIARQFFFQWRPLDAD